jgi:outer membrane beta-barrel protein
MSLIQKIMPLFILIFCQVALSQTKSEDLEVLNIEDLYSKDQVTQPAKKQQVPIQAESPSTLPDLGSDVLPNQPAEESAAVIPEPKVQNIKVRDLKDLNQLVPFSEVSVIQKKFMPKTERFQFFAGAGITTNTPWFTNYGLKLNLSYNFTESFGLELNTLFLTSSARQVAKEILAEHDIQADQFIYTKGYYGLDLVWSPIYGKLSFNNESIVNYEMYFSIGGGQSSTNSVEKNVPTLHLAVGQIFALSKSLAFRWDYGFSMFQATPGLATGTGSAASKNMYNDLVLTAGVSFFFPEVDYR